MHDEGLDRALAGLGRVVLEAAVHACSEVHPALTPLRMRALTLIAAAHRGVSLAVVAEGLSLSAPSASRLCSGLVRAGWLDRSPDARRKIRLTVSEAGADVLHRVNSGHVRQLRSLVETLPEPDRGAVIRAITLLTSNDHAATGTLSFLPVRRVVPSDDVVAPRPREQKE